MPSNRIFGKEVTMNVLDQVREILAEQTHAPIEELNAHTQLKELGIESVDVIEVLFRLEERFNIELPFYSRTEFTTNEDYAGTCQGDSGGPAFVRVGDKHVLVGITSRGEKGCQGEGIYTKVNAYTDWIKATVQEFSTTN